MVAPLDRLGQKDLRAVIDMAGYDFLRVFFEKVCFHVILRLKDRVTSLDTTLQNLQVGMFCFFVDSCFGSYNPAQDIESSEKMLAKSAWSRAPMAPDPQPSCAASPGAGSCRRGLVLGMSHPLSGA